MNVLIAEAARFSEHALQRIAMLGEVRAEDLNRADLLEAVRTCHVLWVRLRHQIDKEVLDAAVDLKVIVSPTTGLNHIDLDAAERRGVAVLSLRGETDFLKQVRATAEHTIGLCLALIRNLKPAANAVEEGSWDRDPFRGTELLDKTVGVVGYGRLGRIVADYFLAFGARVLAHDPSVSPDAYAEGVIAVSQQTLLRESDIVTLHVNLDATTERFFGATQFEQLKAGARFINTARGELVDEAALMASLRSGRLAGAALDVLCNEDAQGMAEHPLVEYARKHENLLITPHIGGCTMESMEKTERFLADKLLNFLAE